MMQLHIVRKFLQSIQRSEFFLLAMLSREYFSVVENHAIILRKSSKYEPPLSWMFQYTKYIYDGGKICLIQICQSQKARKTS